MYTKALADQISFLTLQKGTKAMLQAPGKSRRLLSPSLTKCRSLGSFHGFALKASVRLPLVTCECHGWLASFGYIINLYVTDSIKLNLCRWGNVGATSIEAPWILLSDLGVREPYLNPRAPAWRSRRPCQHGREKVAISLRRSRLRHRHFRCLMPLDGDFAEVRVITGAKHRPVLQDLCRGITSPHKMYSQRLQETPE